MKTTENLKRTRRIALSAVLSALGVLFLFLGSVIEVLDLTMGAFASLIIVFAVIEMIRSAPWLIYAVTSVLALILLPNKFPAVLYLLFCGIYPILKAMFERLHYVVSWVLKFSAFNSGLLLIVTAAKFILHMPDGELDFTWLVFAVGNATFLIYDIALSKLITLYLVKIRSMLKLKNYFEG